MLSICESCKKRESSCMIQLYIDPGVFFRQPNKKDKRGLEGCNHKCVSLHCLADFYRLTHRSVLMTHFSPSVTSLPSCYSFCQPAITQEGDHNSPAYNHSHACAEAAFRSLTPPQPPFQLAISCQASHQDRRPSLHLDIPWLAK